MKIRVWIQKIALVLSIWDLKEDTIASMVYREQKERKWPGLAAETVNIFQDLVIADYIETYICRKDYKDMMMEACHQKTRKIYCYWQVANVRDTVGRI